MLQTTISERGQISIPSLLRKKYHLKPGMGIMWIEREEGIFIMPLPSDPIEAFKSSLAQGEVDLLLKERKADKNKTTAKVLSQ